jgi:hypothetical protein
VVLEPALLVEPLLPLEDALPVEPLLVELALPLELPLLEEPLLPLEALLLPPSAPPGVLPHAMRAAAATRAARRNRPHMGWPRGEEKRVLYRPLPGRSSDAGYGQQTCGRER